MIAQVIIGCNLVGYFSVWCIISGYISHAIISCLNLKRCLDALILSLIKFKVFIHQVIHIFKCRFLFQWLDNVYLPISLISFWRNILTHSLCLLIVLASWSDSFLIVLDIVSHSSAISINWSITIKLFGLNFLIKFYLLIYSYYVIIDLML